MLKSGIKVAKYLKFIWLVFLFWIAAGGIFAILLSGLDLIGPFCENPGLSENSAYEICKPCGLNSSVFGIIEVGNCDNPLMEFFFHATVSAPRFFIIIITMLIYPIVEFLNQFSKALPLMIFIPLMLGLGLKIVRQNFFIRKNTQRGIHHILLLAVLALSIHLATNY